MEILGRKMIGRKMKRWVPQSMIFDAVLRIQLVRLYPCGMVCLSFFCPILFSAP